MSKLTVIIDEFATSKEEDILFLKNYDDFLNHWEVVLEALWETEGKIIISHPIIKDYFVSLREAVRDRIEILESNPRMQLAKALGVKQDDLNYLSYQEILKHKLLEKINRSPLEVGEDPFLWILKNLSQRPFLVSNRINYIINYFANNAENFAAIKSAKAYIYKKNLYKYPVIKWVVDGDATEKSKYLLLYLYLKSLFNKEEIEILLQALPPWMQEIENLSPNLEGLYSLFPLDECLNQHFFLKKNIQQKLISILNEKGLEAFLDKISGKLTLEMEILKDWFKKQALNFTQKDLNPSQEQKIRQKFGNKTFISILKCIPPPKPSNLSLDTTIEDTLNWIEEEYLPFFIWTREHEQYELTEPYVNQFQQWLLSCYEKLIHSEHSSVNIFKVFQKILRKYERVLYIIVDGLSYWFLILSLLPDLKIDMLRTYFCLAPSITSINKPCLLSGKLPQDIEVNHYTLAEELGDVVSNDSKETLGSFAKRQFHLGIYFVNSFDELLHKPYSYAILKKELEHKLNGLFKEISLLKDVFVVITGDHGFTILPKKEDNLVALSDLRGEVSHCRVLKPPNVTEISGCVKMDKYLSCAYLIASGYKYLESFPKGATHGGLSPEEMTIPLLTISSSPEIFKPLEFRIKGEIWKKEIKPVELLIENPNKSNIIVEDLSVEFLKFQQRVRILKHGTNRIAAEFDARNIEKSEVVVRIWYKVRYRGKMHERETNLSFKLRSLMEAEWEDIFDV